MTKRPTFSHAPLFALTLALVSTQALSQVYVSPSGRDTNPGTSSRPVQTLTRASALARQARIHARGNLRILLAGGTYHLTQPLVLGPEDSGSPGHDIVYTALPGERPVLSGAIRVKGWKQIDASRNLWSAPVPAGTPASRQLYVDGVRATRTRGRLPVDLTMTSSGYTAASSVMAGWKNPSALEFVYTGGNSVWSETGVGLGSWTEPRCPVASIQGTAITMQQPCWMNSTQRIMLPNGSRTANLVGPRSVGRNPTYVENAFELLGTPGQFYLDTQASSLYYTPRAGEDLEHADVELPALQSLLDLTGTPSSPVHNIVFSGIQFSYATWLGPNGPDGFSEIQAGYQVTGPQGYSRQALCNLVSDGTCPYGAWTKEPGNITLHFAHDVHFTRDAFVHLGAAGLDLGDGAQHTFVEGCVFTDISGNGLELAGVDAPLASDPEFASDNRIANNLFESVGAEYRGGIGIVIGYARRTLVTHNQIDHTPYAAISIGWGGWPDKIKMAGQANRSTGNVISQNLIRNFMLVLSDGGGIYTQGRTGQTLADGERVSGNVIYDQYSSGHGIYTDNGSSMIKVEGNVIFHTNHDNWGSRHRDWYDGHDGATYDPLLVADNYWQQGDPDSSHENVTERNNHLINSLAEVPNSLLETAGLQPQFRHLTSLHFAKSSPPEAPSRVAVSPGKGFALITWSPSVQQGGSPVDSYIVRASSGAQATISNADFWKYTYLRLTGLPAGQPLTFTVAAVNRQGKSVVSLPSRPITLSDDQHHPPPPPANVSVKPGKEAASIHFQLPVDYKPENDGPILAYSVTIRPGGRKVLFTGRNIIVLEGRHATFNVVDGLTSGTSYTFSVSAVNDAGEGAPAVVGPVDIP